MATRVHIGARELRGDLDAYAKRFDLLEVRGVAAASLRTAPSPATMRRWRRAAPPKFEFAVVAGPTLAKLVGGEAAQAEREAMLAAATLLEARVLVVATPPDVTPGRTSRDRLAKLFDGLPRDASAVVWEPSGLWEVEDAAAQAKKWGVFVAVDPSRDPFPEGAVAYGRLRALGGTRAYSAAALEKVAAGIGERRDAYVVIETNSALKEAKTLRALVRGARSKQRGLGRLVRPRGAPLRVTDDEQEE